MHNATANIDRAFSSVALKMALWQQTVGTGTLCNRRPDADANADAHAIAKAAKLSAAQHALMGVSHDRRIERHSKTEVTGENHLKHRRRGVGVRAQAW